MARVTGRAPLALPWRMSDFKRLLVWQKAHALALHVHWVATRIRGPENAALRSQLIRAAQSIPANIVEGHGQESAKEFARFVRYSINSTSELEYHTICGRDVQAIPECDFTSLTAEMTEVRRMLYGLLSYLRNQAPRVKRSRT
jgi:four helix bundle protein